LLDDTLVDWPTFGRSSDAFGDLRLFERHAITRSLENHHRDKFKPFKGRKPRATSKALATSTNGIAIV
jgi:hypothetical protein